MVIINDETPASELFPEEHGRGLDLSPRPFEGYAYAGVAEPFPRELLIPRSEWQARIKERQERKARLRDLCSYAGLRCKDQGQTNYCWINAPAYCLEVVRAIQNQPLVYLSPASAGAQIKGYRNVGGWGKEGLEFIAERGLVPVDRWPANAIDRRYKTDENDRIALDYRTSEWWELEPRNLDQTVSCMLRNIPVAVGYNWWRHEVSAIDPVWVDGEVAIQIRNSWGMAWGEEGYGILQGTRMLPDDAVAPRVAIAS